MAVSRHNKKEKRAYALFSFFAGIGETDAY